MQEMVVEYLCPSCDTQLAFGSERCPGCGAIVEWMETREPAGGVVAQGPTDQARSAMGPDAEAPRDAPTRSEEEATPVRVATPERGAAMERPVAEESRAATPAWDVAPPARSLSRTPVAAHAGRLYFLGVFSRRGLVAMALMLVAFGGTVMAARWDTWVGGAGTETLGRMQLTAVYLGLATILVAGSVGVWDAYRAAGA